MQLLGNGRLVTRDPAHPYFAHGAVVLDGETIAAVGEESALRHDYPDAAFLDAGGGIIMPGLINAHTHIYSGLARGLSIQGNNPSNFLETLEGTWWNIDRRLTLDATRACGYATLLDCIRNGVTTVFDHHASYGHVPGSLFAIADVAKELGVRVCLCYEVSDRDGEAKCDEAIRENADFARFAKQANSDMVKAMFGGHALFTLSDKTLEKMVAANDTHTGYHIHVSEGTNDVDDSAEHYGCRPVDRLLRHGILGEKTLLGHCIHVDQREMELIRSTGTMVVNNPESNMGNAVGCSPVLRLMEKEILVGLGTDAYTHDMLESLKVALLIQRHNAGLPNVAWREVTEMLFQNNAKIAARYFGKPIGVLQTGAAADVIVMEYEPFTPLDGGNIDGHMLFGMAGRNCTTTIINGRLLYHNRKFVDIDEERLNARILAQAQTLWGELNGGN